MDYQKAIETLQDIHDVAEVRIKSGDTRGVVYIPSEKIKDRLEGGVRHGGA